jgi:hypothetical protein
MSDDVRMSQAYPCELCGAHVVDLRRGRCFACYQRWVASRPVGFGAECTVCGDRRRDNLHGMELFGAWVAMCFNCAGRTQRLEPLPRTLDGIRGSLKRDRRDAERRIGLPDERAVRAERRGLERRNVGHAIAGDLLLVDDVMRVEL